MLEFEIILVFSLLFYWGVSLCLYIWENLHSLHFVWGPRAEVKEQSPVSADLISKLTHIYKIIMGESSKDPPPVHDAMYFLKCSHRACVSTWWSISGYFMAETVCACVCVHVYYLGMVANSSWAAISNLHTQIVFKSYSPVSHSLKLSNCKL